MKRLIVAISLLFAAAPVLAAEVAPAPNRCVVEAKTPKESQVLIGYDSDPAEDGTVTHWYGTGSAVAYEDNKTLILTNAHVAPYAKGTYHVYFDKKKHKATWLAATKMTDTPMLRADGTQYISRSFENDVDLAIISVSIQIPFVKLAEDNAKFGEKLYQWGFSNFTDENAGPPNSKTGTVSQCSNEKHTDSDLLSQPGDSGSGLFNEKNELVGVTAWGNNVLTTRTMAMSNKTVRDFLVKKGVRKWFPRFGAHFPEVVKMPDK